MISSIQERLNKPSLRAYNDMEVSLTFEILTLSQRNNISTRTL